MSRELKLLGRRSVTLGADHWIRNLGEGENVGLVGPSLVDASRSVAAFAGHALLGVHRLFLVSVKGISLVPASVAVGAFL